MSNKQLYIYYGLLVLIMVGWTSFSAPPAILRIVYLIAVLIPPVLYNISWLPAAIVGFWGISEKSYAYSFMPTDPLVYAVILVVLYCMHSRNLRKADFIWIKSLWIFLAFIACTDLLNGLAFSRFNYCLLVTLLMTLFISDEDENVVEKFDWAFIIISLAISYLSLTSREMFTQTTSDMERVGWGDPNYLSMVIAMGSVIAFRKLLHFNLLSLVAKIICTVTLGMSVIAMLFLASRGAFLCLMAGITILILSGGYNTKIKILVPACFLVFAYYLYTNDYFYILQNRIEQDDGTGSARTYIWSLKLDEFLSQNPLRWIFGNGYDGAYRLVDKGGVGFHNDYLAILCGYGLIGIIMFFNFLSLPIRATKFGMGQIRDAIVPILYLVVACLTLEPFTLGDFTFFAFYLYALVVAKFGVKA